MSDYLSPSIGKLTPYVPGEQPRDGGYIKLNTNENPYPPSPRVIEAIRNETARLRLYPDPESEELKAAVSEYYNIDKNQVFTGNGSDEILALSFMAFFMKDKPILFPDVTYSFYEVYAALYGIKYNLVPLNPDFTVPVEKFCTENAGIVLANPNAPTGIALGTDEIRTILENNRDKVVLVDEAYVDFGAQSMVPFIKDYPNLLIVQTLSKSRSLAGLRVGFAIGDSKLVEGLNRVKNSFNSYPLDRLAIKGAIEAFKDVDYFKETTWKIVNTRERVKTKLRDLGFIVTESRSNFLFVSHPGFPARDMFARLKEKKVLVRYFDKPRIDNYLRVTIGTDDEMDIFLQRVKEIFL
ncbi:MAG TPA: histidinol-phosphate transaminase [Clostridiaceae bacterium]|nr:histidinol-phosphate transaminase [Clostridiaceae bacterium]